MSAAAVALSLAFGNPAASVVIDRVVATVNGEAITLYELYLAELPVFGTAFFPGGTDLKTPDDRAKERQLLEGMIIKRLLLQRARQRGLAAEMEEVDAAVRRLKESGNLTDEMLESALAQQHLTMALLRQQFSEQLTVEKLKSTELRRQTVVTAEEIETYYRRNSAEFTTRERAKIRHILIVKNSQGLQDPRALSQTVAEALASGADFQEMAQNYSQDSAKRKGEVSEWIQKGDALPELEQAIFGLEPGATSPVIETNVGYHIIKVESREPARTASLEDVYEEIRNRLFDEKLQVRFREWIEEMRRGATIEMRL